MYAVKRIFVFGVEMVAYDIDRSFGTTRTGECGSETTKALSQRSKAFKTVHGFFLK